MKDASQIQPVTVSLQDLIDGEHIYINISYAIAEPDQSIHVDRLSQAPSPSTPSQKPLGHLHWESLLSRTSMPDSSSCALRSYLALRILLLSQRRN